MKKIGLALVALSALAFSTIATANPKCNHRLASAGNDLHRSTNPAKTSKTVADVKVSGSGRQKQGTR